MRFWTASILLCGLVQAANAQWQLQQSHATADLRGVHALSDQVAWTSGSGGTVLHTVDGGSTWQRCATPPAAEKLDFRGIQGFDANTAIVMSSGKGELSRLYKTIDACKTWSLVLTNPDPDDLWDSIQFEFNPGHPPEKGYFDGGVLIGHPVGGEFTIFTSKDYGSTWHSLREDEAYSPGPSAWANAGECLFPASNTAVTATADDNTFAFVTGGPGGGRLLFPQGHRAEYDVASTRYTFSTLQLPISAGATSGGFSIAARRTSATRVDLMIVGGDYSNPQVGTAVFVRHAGPNYKKLLAPRVTAATHPPNGYRSAVAYNAASDTWLTVGPNGTDVSRDDGRSWTAVGPSGADPADAVKNWQAISLPFAVGPAGRIGKLRSGVLVR